MTNFFGSGFGGGKSGSGSGRTPVEEPNSLLSKSTVRIIDVISEGPISGLVDGFKSIYLDDTPVQNSDGTFNYQGFSYQTRNGTPDQSFVSGFPAVENEKNVGIQVKKTLPISVQINETDADAIMVKIRVNSMTNVNTKTGDIKGTSVTLAFDIRTVSGSFVEVGTMTISGKTTAAYERSQRLELPEGGSPWTLRVRRITDDSETSNISNDTYFSTYTVIYDAKLSYPDTALIAYKIDAQQFGSNSPTRAVKIRGLITDVPTNYNPLTRVYTGIWDGTFKKAWHNNPAWVLWDLMTNNRYGLGDIIDPSNVDKFGLYVIGQYCDELVPNGFGGTEPRYTFNGAINSKQNAMAVLDSISSVFRGMIYWGNGATMFTHDAPGTPVKLVTPANVINGEFNYSGSSIKSRHTSVFVTWNNPDDLGRAAVEPVQRDELIQKFGYRDTTVSAYGCTSRGQARRAGEWLLDTEENETEVVTYAASLDHTDVRPGQLIAIADPMYAGGRFGGRLLASTLNTLTIDAGIEIIGGSVYMISVPLADGTIINRTITNAPGENVAVLNITPDLPSLPVDGALWVISATEAEPRLFRVISNSEKADNIYEITALLHDPTKYARIEENVSLASPNYSIDRTGPLSAPTGLSVVEFFKSVGTTAFPAINFSWVSSDARISGYEIQIQGPGDVTFRPSQTVFVQSADDYPTETGDYRLRVRSTALFLAPSAWSETSVYVSGPEQAPPNIENLSINIVGPNAILSWTRLNNPGVDRIELRFNRNLSGASWENSEFVTDSISANSNSVTVVGRVGTYLMKAVSVADSYSVQAALVSSEIVGAISENVIAEMIDSPDFLGVRDHVQLSEDNLLLSQSETFFMSSWSTLSEIEVIGGDFVSEGYYYFENDIDLGAVGASYVDYIVGWNVVDLDQTISSWIDLASVSSIATVSDKAKVEFQFSVSNDNVTFTDWEKLTVGNYLFRSIKFRIKLTSDVPTVTPSVFEASVIVDMDDRLANGYDVACPASGLRIDFAPHFMSSPSVHIDGQGLVTGDYHNVTDRDETGFFVQFFNSAGVGKSATFDWIAKGYGYKQ